MMQAALLVGLAMAVLWFAEKMGGTPMVIRPIVVSPVVGALLGDLHTGVLVGATLELVFMGAIQIGAAVPPDVLVGAGLGTAFAIQSGQGADIALALSLPIAILAQSLKVVVFIIRSWFMDLAVHLAEAGDIRNMYMLNIGGLLLQCFMYFGVGFVAVLFGSPAVEAFVNSIPQAVLNGLSVAGGLLPAVGFALLLLPMMDKRNVLYFILGFVLVSYLKLPVMAITILGIVLAFIICYERGAAREPAVRGAAAEEEDLFDE